MERKLNANSIRSVALRQCMHRISHLFTHVPPASVHRTVLRMSSTIASPAVNKLAHPFERAALDGLLIKRFFYCPAFEIYGGASSFR